MSSELSSTISRLFAEGERADKTAARDAFFELQRQLGRGDVRAAERDAASPSGWRVNAWVKQGILLGFRFGDVSRESDYRLLLRPDILRRLRLCIEKRARGTELMSKLLLGV